MRVDFLLMNVLGHPKVLISHHKGLWKAHNTFDNILAKEFLFNAIVTYYGSSKKGH